ncbi:thiol-disulfide oxidoreductase [Salipaludibacillus neizhouensis]|uniref:Thiol-disulfide oxidoreductase n=1 Tax=Salipaludibacillus neizhouensis TaxID=885475 RepID=A0A3A9KIA7_9BACI|nr:thiol-disulfide oxidoreductase DCC family protein [Salipaludibacillus neizhouensis]RKL69313.1 thiol-disulfide oxidoreductase [Salipaludibacillus neizhouensis]
MNHVILFDGVCNVCSSSVQFIMKRDLKGTFKFASLQSKIGQELVESYNISKDLDSLILIENNGLIYDKSTAALRVGMRLKGGWTLLRILLVIPSILRDFFYNRFAANRYKWFGKKNECMIPTLEQRERFLDK